MANLAQSTQFSYLYEIERLAGHYKASLADLDGDQLRAWVLRLIDLNLSPATTNSTLSALRFLYVETLGCPERVSCMHSGTFTISQRDPAHCSSNASKVETPRQLTQRSPRRNPSCSARASATSASSSSSRPSRTIASRFSVARNQV